MSTATATPPYSKDDFVSDQDVRWCPGCGDYAILHAVQKIMPDLGVAPENVVFVSGIGCSSRFPFYMDTYGFHTIHGRAPCIASGIKAINPDVDLWLVTGDGDGLSIGGNHLLHTLRRNFRVKILLFNNRIYGLTKGQYSPTSEVGQITKSSPMGAIDHPVEPVPFAIGAGASFVARTADNQIKHMEATIRRAAEHDGTAFVEILQNCVIFNHGTWDGITGREQRTEHQLLLEHGQPLIYGSESQRGIVQRGFSLAPTILEDGETTAGDCMVHDERMDDPTYAYALSRMGIGSEGPLALGVLRQVLRPTYEQMHAQEMSTARAGGEPSLQDMFQGFGKAATWVV
ncbi:MAG: 2-oxoacid:ferredoxin oxidoreductase subunit beta [Planctomycetota bacterium]|nr:MAG: 2-oxoacid:ferredoxin oxidoreductase subunit beta [Planctomycetota bacterium]